VEQAPRGAAAEAERGWWDVPEDDAREWLELTAEAQAAWLCGLDGWFPAHRGEAVGPYRVFRMVRLDVHLRYEIGPEWPDGMRVRITNSRGRMEEWTWDRPYIDSLALYCGPPEEQYWADLGGTEPSSDSPEA